MIPLLCRLLILIFVLRWHPHVVLAQLARERWEAVDHRGAVTKIDSRGAETQRGHLGQPKLCDLELLDGECEVIKSGLKAWRACWRAWMSSSKVSSKRPLRER